MCSYQTWGQIHLYLTPCLVPIDVTVPCVWQVWYHSGMSDNVDHYELCMRAESVTLPAEGYFGVSAATGGLAGETF